MVGEARLIAYRECGTVMVVLEGDCVYHGQTRETERQAKLVEKSEKQVLDTENETYRLGDACYQNQEMLDCDHVSDSPAQIWLCLQEKDSACASASLVEKGNSQDVDLADFRTVFVWAMDDAWDVESGKAK